MLSLPSDLAHAIVDGAASDVPGPRESWYRGTIGIHARGRGPGKLGRLRGTATLRDIHPSALARFGSVKRGVSLPSTGGT